MYEKAIQIIERFYGCEDDEEDADLAPTVTEGATTFSFGVNDTNLNAVVTPSKAPGFCGLEMNSTPGDGGAMGVFESPVRTLNFA